MFVSEILPDVLETLGRDNIPEAFKRITRAIEALQDEGDWNANIGVVDIKVSDDQQFVTLPPRVETPLAVAINCRPAFMRDEFFKYHLNGDGLDKDTVPWAWDDNGIVPVFMDIRNPGPIIVVNDLTSDTGIRLRVLGEGPDGKKLRDQDIDGIWTDGIWITSKMLKDFPGGDIIPPTFREFRRRFIPSPMKFFRSSTPHELATGAYMQLSLATGTMPNPLEQGAFYYVRVEDEDRITLHTNRLDSRTGQSPVEITDLSSSSTIDLTDKRNVNVRTQFQTLSSSVLVDFDLVTFLTLTEMPIPISTNETYVVRMNGSDKFRIFGNRDDAESLSNPVNVITRGDNVRIRSLKPTDPLTILNFTVNHNMLTGDAITIENSGGELPLPLLAGVTYFVRSRSSRSMTLHATSLEASTGVNAIALTSLGSGTNSVVKVIPAQAFPGNSGNISAPGHNLDFPAGAGATATASVSGGNVTSINVVNNGSGYLAPPKVVITGGGGTGAVARAILGGGTAVASYEIIAAGTGYVSPPVVTIVPAGGSLVRFSSTGNLPTPITQGTVYRAESPMTSSSFTLNSTVPEPINISGSGSGSLFLVISRSFSIGFLPQFQVNATNYITGSPVRFFTQGVLPTTSPVVDQSTIYYIRKLSNTLVEIYQTKIQAENLASTTGRINIVALGSLQLYFSYETDVEAILWDNFLDIEFTGYLQNMTNVRFETNGTLPPPLTTSDEYQVSLVNDLIQVFDTSGDEIVLTNIGSGNHQLVVDRNFSIDSSTELIIPDNQFSTGDEIKVETTDALPDPLVVNTTYFVRALSSELIELYPTLIQAENIGATTGRITYLTVGKGLHNTYQQLTPFEVSRVFQMEKPQTDGYVTAYAWDSVENPNLVLLGEIEPQITHPEWRRIKIAKKSKIVRMKYRSRSMVITSERDFINLGSSMAIICMVRSQDLILKDFQDEGERFRQRAVDLLNKRNRSLDGARAPTIQINSDVTTVPGDWMD